MLHLEVLGWSATCFTIVFLIPQIIKIYKAKNAKEISLFSMLILIIASTLWTIYGFLLDNPQMYVTNIVQSCFTLLILIYKIRDFIILKK